MSRYRELKSLRHSLLKLIDSLQPEKILNVGPWLLGEMASYSNSPAFYRRRRAECLHTAVAFRLMGLESRRDHSAFVRHHLGRAAEWRRREHPTPAKIRRAA